MNECTENEIQEMLPDLLHGTLGADARARVEAHVASCGQCREELEVLRTVKTAAVFAPVIDVEGVVRRIPPYQTIVPVVERPAATRVVSWLVAASLAIAVFGGGSLILARRDVPGASRAVATTKPPTHALALAADVDALSDGGLEQLMNEMTRFDALPATEADPVIFEDTSYNLDQDSR